MGAYEKCIVKNSDFKLRRKVWINEETQYRRREDTPTTVLPIVKTSSLPNEKNYFRL